MGTGTRWARNLEGPDDLELFLVAAVTAVLGIRLFLHLTGYPQVGGATLHVAHMLWGGLLMLAAIVVVLSFLGRASERAAALLGGLGFGTFIDEVGKFVTRDNDYFFQPAVAMIYGSFVLTFLVAHVIQRRVRYSPLEYLMNALRALEEVARGDLDEDEKRKALACLAGCDPGDPLVQGLRRAVESVTPQAMGRPSALRRAAQMLRELYARLTRLPGFDLAVVLFFLGQLLIGVAYVSVFILLVGFGFQDLLDVRLLSRIATRVQGFEFSQVAELVAWSISGAFILLGVLRMRRSRLQAYRMFERAVLASILLVQVFVFYREQFAALVGLTFNVLLLAALRIMIGFEEERAAGGSATVVATSGAAPPAQALPS
jgi:hypothetical protein